MSFSPMERIYVHTICLDAQGAFRALLRSLLCFCLLVGSTQGSGASGGRQRDPDFRPAPHLLFACQMALIEERVVFPGHYGADHRELALKDAELILRQVYMNPLPRSGGHLTWAGPQRQPHWMGPGTWEERFRALRTSPDALAALAALLYDLGVVQGFQSLAFSPEVSQWRENLRKARLLLERHSEKSLLGIGNWALLPEEITFVTAMLPVLMRELMDLEGLRWSQVGTEQRIVVDLEKETWDWPGRGQPVDLGGLADILTARLREGLKFVPLDGVTEEADLDFAVYMILRMGKADGWRMAFQEQIRPQYEILRNQWELWEPTLDRGLVPPDFFSRLSTLINSIGLELEKLQQHL